MHLDTSERESFLSILHQLLAYANTRLEVVTEESATEDVEDGEVRDELVARALWRRTDLIDEYARSNPDHLDDAQLQIVRDLRGVIYDDLICEGMSEGCLTFLHETGAYRALSLSGEPEACAEHHAPVTLRAALVPYGTRILVVAPITAIGKPTDGHREALRKGAQQRDALTPTADGSVLYRRAIDWQREKRQHRQREQGWDCEGKPGPGYHRGLLAGLSDGERNRMRADRYDRAARDSGVFAEVMALRSLDCRGFPLSLREALDLLDSDWLMSVAQHVADLDAPPERPRDQLIDLICRQVTHDGELRDTALMWCEDAQFELLRRLMRRNPIPLSDLPPSEAIKLYPMIPYVFVFQDRETFVAWMPPEIVQVMRDTDFDGVTAMRTRISQVAHAADALASQCGIIRLDEAYRCYRAAATQPLTQEQFEQALMELEVCDTRDSYAIWNYQESTYLVSAELSEQGALTHAIRDSYADRIVELASDDDHAVPYLPLAEHDEDELRERLEREYQRIMAMRLRLIDEHRKHPPRPLDPSMLERGYVEYLMMTGPLMRTRAYVDRHIPDDEDDFEFAETFCRAIIISALFEQEPYDCALDLIRLFGMRSCEGEHYPHRLGRLITDVFNALPQWHLNGWSLAENTERISGRTPPLEIERGVWDRHIA